MPIKFRCPKCRQAYSISSKQAGTSIRCQKCEAKMRIPSLDGKRDGGSSGKSKKSASEPAESISQPSSAASEPTADKAEDESLLAAAMQNLIDDDDNIGDDELMDLSADEAPDNSQAPSAGVADQKKEEAAEEDDLAAVLAFEQALEEEEGPAAPVAPLPDELFSEDEEDDDDEGFGSSRAGDDEEMDLTPMVDVTFLLLIFFMITASFSIQKTLEVPPPNPDEKGAAQSQTIKDFEDQSVMVYIDSRNVISVDDEPLGDPSRLADVMRSKRMSEVLITAHENSMHDMLVKVIDAANEIGMQKIRVGVSRGAE